MSANDKKIELLREVAAETGGRYHGDYSGRGMCGETCASINCDDANEVVAAAGAAGIRGARTERMGRGSVVYWPSIKTTVEVK